MQTWDIISKINTFIHLSKLWRKYTNCPILLSGSVVLGFFYSLLSLPTTFKTLLSKTYLQNPSFQTLLSKPYFPKPWRVICTQGAWPGWWFSFLLDAIAINTARMRDHHCGFSFLFAYISSVYICVNRFKLHCDHFFAAEHREHRGKAEERKARSADECLLWS